jgi:mono/diheme cytochrome c family protein
MMRMQSVARPIVIAALTIGMGTMALAQKRGPGGLPGGLSGDRGKYEYGAHCAMCHGLSGKGDGPYAGVPSKTVPNLTTLSKKNGGVFPFARVYETIDGSQVVPAHGPKDMPIWGPRYKIEAEESLYDDFRADREVFVRARILALTEYIYRLQAK